MGSYGNDSSVCMRVSNTRNRDYCLAGVAPHSRNSSLCDMINDSSMKQCCYSNVASAKQGSKGPFPISIC
jgi:hypothetical protein